MHPILTTHLAFGGRALHAVVDAMPLISFEASQRPHIYAVALHCSTFQYCGGCHSIARTEHTAGIPVLLRSMFEALVDLQNLLRNAGYHEHMEAANY